MKQTLIILIAISVYSLSYSQNALYGVINGTTTSKEGWTCKCDRCENQKLSTQCDTLQAYLLITTKPMGIAYQKRGFVVIKPSSTVHDEIIFLDCEKRVIKPPYTVWSHRLIINK